MSDYEEDSISMETDYYDAHSEADAHVVIHLIVTVKKCHDTKEVPLYIKYYDEREAIDAEGDDYYNEMKMIDDFIERLYPGWSIDEIRTEGYSDSPYFDIYASSETE